MQTVSVNLNIASIVGRVSRTIEEVTRHVASSLAQTEKLKTELRAVQTKRVTFQISSGLEWTDEEARIAWKQWILRNGFRDISEEISGVLEEAFGVLSFYKLLDEQSSGTTLSQADLVNRAKEISKFHRLTLPDKIDLLKNEFSFSIPDEKVEQIKSINAARNCLSHRKGIVGEKDISSNGKLIATWLGTDFIIETDGKEILFEGPIYLENGGTLCMRLVSRSREFPLGTRIEFDEHQFAEIAWTMFNFAQAVAVELENHGKNRGIEFPQAPV